MVGSDHDDLAVLAAWIDDHPTPPSEVRRILCDLIDGLAAAAAEVPEGTAASMAAARSHSVVPRVVRQSLPERTSGHRYLLELLTGEEPSNDDRAAFERMIGLRSGRGGGLASMLGLGVEPADLDFLRTPEATRKTIAESTDEQLELVRLVVQFLADWMPALLPVLLGEAGPKGEAFGKLVREHALASSGLEVPVVLVLPFLAGVTSRTLPSDELGRLTDAFDSGTAGLGILEELPQGERRRVADGLPDRARRRLAHALARAQVGRRR